MKPSFASTLLLTLLFLTGCIKTQKDYLGVYNIRNQSSHKVEVFNLKFIQTVRNDLTMEPGISLSARLTDESKIPEPWVNQTGDVRVVFDDTVSMVMSLFNKDLNNNILFEENWLTENPTKRTFLYSYTLDNSDYQRALGKP